MTNSSCCVDLPMGHACLLDGWGRTEDSHCVFEGQEKLWEWMQSSAEVARVEATAQYSLYGLTGNGRLFFSYGQQGSVPTSDCCKELTVKLISFFFSYLCYLFFLTPVAKYSRSLRKVQPGRKYRAQRCELYK